MTVFGVGNESYENVWIVVYVRRKLLEDLNGCSR